MSSTRHKFLQDSSVLIASGAIAGMIPGSFVSAAPIRSANEKMRKLRAMSCEQRASSEKEKSFSNLFLRLPTL